MFTTLSVIGLVAVGQITKKYILPKFGNFGLHVFLFVLALCIAGVQAAMTIYPGFNTIALEAGRFLIGAIAVYEILWKKFSDLEIPELENPMEM